MLHRDERNASRAIWNRALKTVRHSRTCAIQYALIVAVTAPIFAPRAAVAACDRQTSPFTVCLKELGRYRAKHRAWMVDEERYTLSILNQCEHPINADVEYGSANERSVTVEARAIKHLTCSSSQCTGFGTVRLGCSQLVPEPIPVEQLSQDAPENTPVALRPVTFSEHNNYDLDADPYTSLQDLSSAECKDTCARNEQCQSYTFDKWNQICYLKGAPTAMRLDPKATSGLKEGLTPPQTTSAPINGSIFPNRRIEGPEISQADSSTLAKCRELCRVNNECLAFHFGVTNKECKLLSTADRIVNDPKATSGIFRQE